MEEKGEEVRRDTIVVVGALEAVEREGCDGGKEGWEGKVDIGRGIGEVREEGDFFVSNVDGAKDVFGWERGVKEGGEVREWVLRWEIAEGLEEGRGSGVGV